MGGVAGRRLARALYTTYKAHYREVECMRVEMEELLYAYGVDVVFTGRYSGRHTQSALLSAAAAADVPSLLRPAADLRADQAS